MCGKCRLRKSKKVYYAGVTWHHTKKLTFLKIIINLLIVVIIFFPSYMQCK